MARISVLHLLLIVTIYMTCSETSADNSYVIVGPQVVRPGMTYNAAVTILDTVTSKVTLTVSIYKKTDDFLLDIAGRDSGSEGEEEKPSPGSLIASETIEADPGIPGSVSLQLPNELTPGTYILAVEGKGTVSAEEGFGFYNTTDLEYNSKGRSVFIQTDKATYKPSDKVQFRAITVNPYLRPYRGTLDVDIKDPNGNKMVEWNGLATVNGVATLDFMLSDQPVFGTWIITVNSDGEEASKNFEVEEYVLPRFEVKVDLPSFLVGDSFELSGTVGAKYTHGGPVKGKAVVSLIDGERKIVTRTVQIDGEATFTFNVLSIVGDGRRVKVEAVVTEEATGVELSGEAYVTKYRHPVKMTFQGPDYFKPGLAYFAVITFERQDGSPLLDSDPDEVELTSSWDEKNPNPDPDWPSWDSRHRFPMRTTETYTIPADGRVVVQIEVPSLIYGSINFNAKYTQSTGDVAAHKSASEYKAGVKSFVQVGLRSADLVAGDQAAFLVESTDEIDGVFYQVISRGNIEDNGYVKMGNKEQEFSIEIDNAMAPRSRMLVYYIHSSGEVITDATNFEVQGGFDNQVALRFNKESAEPGDKVKLRITTAPWSFIGILAVDQSVLLLRGGNDITADSVLDDVRGYGFDDDDSLPVPFLRAGGRPIRAERKKRSFILYPWHWYSSSDAYETFREAKLAVVTDTYLYREHHGPPILYLEHDIQPVFDRPLMRGIPGPMPAPAVGVAVARAFKGVRTDSASNKKVAPIKKVRKDFPESWLWIDTDAGSDGSTEISTNVPDTITSWIASAFAISDTYGLGIGEETAKITVSRPFFVQLDLPYSVIRGEDVFIRVLVFNYLDHDTNVFLTLGGGGEAFEHVGVPSSARFDSRSKTIKAPAGEPTAVLFGIKPLVIGEISMKISGQTETAADAVRKNLRVKPEGVTRYFNKAHFVDLTQEDNVKIKTTIPWFVDIIDGSERLEVSVIGDLMGPSIKNLDRLIRMPTGCGEQNMIGFAPNIFVSNYLVAVDEYTPDLQAKTKQFMDIGYQRELKYQREDGSFSAFGNSDDYGSVWLTAFVAKSFSQADKYLFIDPKVMTRTLLWLVRHQQDDGAFKEVGGRVIHKDMQGQASEGIALSAYTLISLLEVDRNMVEEGIAKIDVRGLKDAIKKAADFLASKVETLETPYDLALVNYAFTLMDHPMTSVTQKKFEALAITEDDKKYWMNPQEEEKPSSYYLYHNHKSVDIEMTAYGLLTYLASDNLVDAIPVMKWLVSQRNSLGGFSSTQDTIIGLQALSEFGEKTQSPETDIEIDITAGPIHNKFVVNAENADLLQEWVVGSPEQTVSFTASGTGTSLVQVSWQYNEIIDDLPPAYNISTKGWSPDENVVVVEICTRYLNDGPSGMSVAEIQLPSGFKVDEDQLNSLTSLRDLQRVEPADEGSAVNIYYNQIPNEEDACARVHANRVFIVDNLKDSPARVYSYYNTEEEALTQYKVADLAVPVPVDDEEPVPPAP